MSLTITPIPLSISQAYLVIGERAVLIDTGGPADEQRLRAALRDHDLGFADLALVVLTHGHTDHTGVAAALSSAGAPIAIGRGDDELLRQGRNGILPATGLTGHLLAPIVRRSVVRPAQPDIVVHTTLDLREYGVDAEVERVGGHTPGSVLVRAGVDTVVGDLIRGGILGPIRPGYPQRHYFMEDAGAARVALDAALGEGTERLLPGHGGPLVASEVRRRFDRVAPRT